MSIIKKLISTTLASAILVTGSSIFASADALEKYETSASDTPYATKVITIDGVKDATYDLGTAMNIDHIGEGKADTDFKGKTYTLWDEEYLYILTEVTDSDVVKSYSGSLVEAKKNDRITYYFDFANTTTATVNFGQSQAVHGLYYGIHCTSDTDYVTTISDGVTNCIYPESYLGFGPYKAFLDSAFKTVVKYTSTGYNAETRIKLDKLRYNEYGNITVTKASNGAKFGFDVYLHDKTSESDGNRVTLCTWSTKTDNKSWETPGFLGTLTMANKPVTAGKNGWIKESDKYHYYIKGTLAKNLFVVKDGLEVFIKKNGEIANKEIITYKGSDYYINGSGNAVMASSGYKIVTTPKKKKYAVNTKGKIQKNKVVKAGANYYVCSKSSGSVYTSNKLITFSGKKYFVKDTGVALKNAWKTYKGATYRFSAKAYAYKNKLVTVKNKLYYFNSSCKMVKNKVVKIGKKSYKFDSKGVGKRIK